MKVFEVIMAGGGGTRFWPLSRKERPKQLLNISGRDIMLNETIRRMDEIVEREDVYIVTNESQQKLMRDEIINGVPFRNILTEPVGRNTSPCVLYAASVLMKLHGDGVMCVFPADHHVANIPEYQRTLRTAIQAAEVSGKIVTIGITPTYPATGYGYISRRNEEELEGVYQVRKFVEKPNLNTAKKYLDEGTYLWNSGVFIWKISTILEAFKRHLPAMYEQMQEIVEAIGTPEEKEVLERVYPQLENISVDYGILEREADVLVLEGDFGWSDVGSLDELSTFHKEDSDGNILLGDVLVINSHNSIVKGNDKLIALVGMENTIVVETDDALLICNKDKAQEVKKVVDELGARHRTELL